MDDVRFPRPSLPADDGPSTLAGRLSRRGLLAVTAAVPASAVAVSVLPARAEPGAGSLSDIPLDGVDHRSVGGALVRVLPDTAATMVGVTWSADDADSAEVVVQVRGKADGADWTPWSVLETAVDPESGTEVPGTEIAWLGEVSALEIRGEFDGADATAAMTAHVLLTQEQGADAALAADVVPQDARSARMATTSASTTAATSPALIGAPPIIRRATWGADEGATRGTSSLDELKSVVVHHTAGTNNYTKSQSAQIVRGIQAYHTGTLDWADVGYNLLIDKYGQIFEGRKGGLHRTIQGAHARGFNESTVGISVLGDYSSASLSTAALDAVAAVAAWKLLGTFRTSVTQTSSFYVSADGVIADQGSTVKLPRFFGHRDVNVTECPGDGVYSKMSRIRSAIQSRIDGGWRTHLNAYLGGGGSALGTVVETAHAAGPYWATKLTSGLILSVGSGRGVAYSTPFALDWQGSWGKPAGKLRSYAGRDWQAFDKGVAEHKGGTVRFVPPRFPDVPPSHYFFLDIADLAEKRITLGAADGTFRPEEDVERDEMVAFLYRALGSPQVTLPTRSPFTDVAPGRSFYKEIVWAAQKGITSGYTDGTFRPNSSVQRGATAAFMYRASGSPSARWSNHFSDITQTSTFAKEICWMADQGIAAGTSDGTFLPTRAVKRDEMAAFIMRWIAQR